MSIPKSPLDLTPEWCTAALRDGGAIVDASVTATDVETVGEGFGLTGVIARVRLTYDQIEKAAPASVVVKLPLAEQAQQSTYRQRVDRDPAAARAHFERAAREVWFYRQFHDSAGAPFPGYFYGAAEPDSGVALMLEDVAPARNGDLLVGSTVADVRAVLTLLARWHAAWWEQPLLAELPWLPRWPGDPRARQARYRALVDAYLTRHGVRTPPSVVVLIEALREQYVDVLNALSDKPVTVIHADMHLDNVLFHAPRDGRVATIIDWQGAARGPCVLDAILFMVDALPVTKRREYGDALLGEYYETLVGNGVTGYARERFVRDCRLALLQRLCGTVTWLAGVDIEAQVGRERELLNDLFERGQFFAALDDYAVEAVLTS